MSVFPTDVGDSRPPRYNEASIRVLKGLEPVRQRPGMYTRTENPLHVVQEVIDNAADEALAGYGKQIQVTLHTDGSVSVEDDGRGIPVGLHPEENAPVVELVFTRLHAGGKFDKQGGGAYAFSGGLHGVGVSVTNALATRLEVVVWRDGGVNRLVFKDGEVAEPLAPYAEGGRKKSGTRVRVWPDTKYFDSPTIPLGELTHLLRSKAVLLPGVKGHAGQREDRRYQDLAVPGRPARLPGRSAGRRRADGALFEGAQYAGADHENFAEGEGAQWVVAWTEDGNAVRESYVNLIPTPAGGTRESGLREGLFGAVKSFAELHSLLPKGVKLLPEDVFARASFVLSAKVLDPQFQGQIKERLNNRRRAPGGRFLQERAGSLAAQQCRVRQEAGRVGDPPGAGAPALGAEGREAQEFRRGRAARQADRLRSQRRGAHRGLSGRGRLGRRLGQDGSRQGIPGHPAAAQGAQFLGSGPRSPVRQQRNP